MSASTDRQGTSRSRRRGTFEAHKSYHRRAGAKKLFISTPPRAALVSNENNLGEISSGENERGGSVQCNPGGQNAENRHDCNHACYEPHESLLSLIGRLALPRHDLARYNTSVTGRNPGPISTSPEKFLKCCWQNAKNISYRVKFRSALLMALLRVGLSAPNGLDTPPNVLTVEVEESSLTD